MLRKIVEKTIGFITDFILVIGIIGIILGPWIGLIVVIIILEAS